MTREAILRGAVVDLIDDTEDLEAKLAHARHLVAEFRGKGRRLRADARKLWRVEPQGMVVAVGETAADLGAIAAEVARLEDELAQREQITLNAPRILEQMAIVEDLRESGLADGLRRAAGILVQLGMGGDAGEAVEFDAQELQGHPPVRA